jgi:uncharacterized protein (TIGR02231 family)
VFNNTGFNWNQVKLRVSTGEPNLTASRPDLERWTINNVMYKRRKRGSYHFRSADKEEDLGFAGNVFSNSDFESLNRKNNIKKYSGNQNQQVKFKQIAVAELSKTFYINKAYTIPANAKPYIIKVTKYELEAKYSYVSVPKLDRAAFLIAHLSDWEELDLVEGPVQVYFGNNYVGKSYIKTQNVPDTLQLSLGRDHNIAISRVKKKEYSNKKTVGNNQKDSYVYEIAVKNNRSFPIQIQVLDQIPISNDSEVSVSINESGEAIYDESEGLLTWNYSIQAKETKKMMLGFTVKYPKGKTIKLKKFTPVSCPSF